MIMSKNNDYISVVSNYMSKILGEQLCIVPLDKATSDKIPLAVSSGYELFKAPFGHRLLILALNKEGNELTSGQLQKQMGLIERKTDAIVVFVFPSVVSYNRKRMIDARVNFVIPNQQMYIPELLIDLRKPKKNNDDLTEGIPSIAQCILLYHLEKESMNGKTIRDVINIFGTSYATANRAFRWLESKQLITEAKHEREKVMKITESKKEVWEKSKPFLTSPIEKVVHTDEVYPTLLESGVNALSEYTMINREHSQTYAISRDEYRQGKYMTDKQYGDNTIEIWRYNPHLFAKGKTVDKLSLFLTLRYNQDERIQKELETLINDKTW